MKDESCVTPVFRVVSVARRHADDKELSEIAPGHRRELTR
jgi:hypothetical protein